MDPTLSDILESQLEWIFVGGKGGVGKTTTSCALATHLAMTPVSDEAAPGGERARKVLLLSTDPAHNLSDAFDQQIGRNPTPIKGMEDTLSAMEIDTKRLEEEDYLPVLQSDQSSPIRETIAPISRLLREAATKFPGMDELVVFVELLKGIDRMGFDVIVFDTAPTGHTLRMLSFPALASDTMTQLTSLPQVQTLISAASAFISSPGTSIQATIDKLMLDVSSIQHRFTDHTKTAFVCVCIPEFLSVYETERLVQELMKGDINCEHVVVNQLVMRPAAEPPCRMCTSRQRIQCKYLTQIDELYEDFHVVKMPLLQTEVRGVPALQRFGHFLMEPYDVEKHGYLDLEGPC
eukprot:gene4821-3462_t